ncbi:NAD-dependent protein deacetylase [Collibacillus ludicampi]|uniref:NAD-dependent protein deacetylase n=1 Tax=Collibacillus ludicampi TaxID=2771369 RepID=A0AAV4LJZ2_9BACL|nr:NAD-dependent protein deacylase [Collibacillus ludicampi]GIM48109.1 NAD-dependent protein deacetylase [Collibacillus ludicampi]
MSIDVSFQQLAEWIEHAKKIVVLTGAGISTESGIPDFRSQDGRWTKYQSMEQVISRDFFKRDPERFWSAFKEIFQLKLMGNFSPNFGHLFFAELEKGGKDVTILTQNVDGLHQSAGSTRVYELHGTLRTSYCPKCQSQYQLQDINQQDVPRCQKRIDNETICHTILKPSVVLFGDMVRHMELAAEEVACADLFVVAGSSLQVSPVNYLPRIAQMNHRTKSVLINKEKTEMDELFDLVIHRPIGDTLREVKKYLSDLLL